MTIDSVHTVRGAIAIGYTSYEPNFVYIDVRPRTISMSLSISRLLFSHFGFGNQVSDTAKTGCIHHSGKERMQSIEAPQCARLLQEIELELKRKHLWQAAPLAPEKLVNMGPFGGNTMGFEQWLQFVFVPAVKEALAGKRDPPKKSEVHIRGVREFEGQSDADHLVQLLCDFDLAYRREVVRSDPQR